MKPETKGYIEKAQQCLVTAKVTLDSNLDDSAGRSAYLAGFNAVRAWIFEQTDKVVKTHSGVRSRFAELTKDDPRIGREYTSFLGWAYDLKTAADYLTGTEALVPRERALDALNTATRFVGCIDAILEKDGK